MAAIHPNHYKYLKAPTVEEMEAVIKASGVCDAQFERFHQMHTCSIKFHRMGYRTMPAKYWHLFLESKSDQPKQKIKSNPHIPKKQKQKIKSNSRIASLID